MAGPRQRCGMEPAGVPPQSCTPAQEAEDPPGSPALPDEEPQSGQSAGEPPGEEVLPAVTRQERSHRGVGSQGPPGRAARGRGRRAPGRRGGEDGGRAVRRPRVTVDSSKAKTSLEALKISLRQLRWREVCAQRPRFLEHSCGQVLPGVAFLFHASLRQLQPGLVLARASAFLSASLAALPAVLGKPYLRCVGVGLSLPKPFPFPLPLLLLLLPLPP